jgi:hypothetical protein
VRKIATLSRRLKNFWRRKSLEIPCPKAVFLQKNPLLTKGAANIAEVATMAVEETPTTVVEEEGENLTLAPTITAVKANLHQQKTANRDNLPTDSVVTTVAPIKTSPTRAITPLQIKPNGTNPPIFPRSHR